jgi:DNA-directed RNA polymerase subunit RPC12/RpoP
MKTPVKFRLIQMPCCGQMLCWVNPRLPNYCPECGERVLMKLRHTNPECILETHEDAWLDYAV